MNAQDVKRRIRVALVETGVDTFAKLAAEAKVHASKISRAVNGFAMLSREEQDRIAAVLHRHPADLFPLDR